MSTLLATIKGSHLQARKQRDKETVACLGTFLGDVQSAEKRGETITDEYVVRLLKKYVENAKQMANEAEVALLSTYLPRQMTEDEICEFIQNCIDMAASVDTNLNMGQLMGALKAEKAGQYDGKLAAKVAKSLISK